MRRALPKLDPTVDLSAHLKTIETLKPWNPAGWFGRTAPLEVEVGTGKGLFLERTGPTRPEHDFLGIELSHKYARFAAYRCARLGLGNVRVADADGLQVFRELVPAASLAAVHVYFPDPWWKARHKKRRVMNAAFVRGGILHFWTDVEEYYHSTVALLAAETKLAGPRLVEERPAEDPRDYRTHRERRVRLAGEQAFRSQYVKTPAPADATPALAAGRRLRIDEATPCGGTGHKMPLAI
jgi:tRNA (guanine-N7-)-methyltransferase